MENESSVTVYGYHPTKGALIAAQDAQDSIFEAAPVAIIKFVNAVIESGQLSGSDAKFLSDFCQEYISEEL